MSILHTDSIRYSLRPSRNSHVKMVNDANASHTNIHLKKDGDVDPQTVMSSDEDNSNGFYEDESDGMNLSPSNDTQEQVELRSSAPRFHSHKFQAGDPSHAVPRTQLPMGSQNYLQNKENISSFANQNINLYASNESDVHKNSKSLVKSSMEIKKKNANPVRNSVKASVLSDQMTNKNAKAPVENKPRVRQERGSNSSVSNASYHRESQHSLISNGEERISHKRNFDTAYNELAYKLYQQQMNESFSRQRKGLNAFDLLLSPKHIKEIEEKKIFDKNYQKELGKRLMGESVAIQEHNQRLASAYLAEQMKECTFAPKIHSNEGEKRTFEEFLEGQDVYLRNLEEKRRRLKEQRDSDFKEENTLKPEIDRNSKKMIEIKQQTSPRATMQVFERLYQVALSKSGAGQNQNNSKVNESQCSNFFPAKDSHKARNYTAGSSTEEQNSFRPSIQERSRKLVRSDPIDKHLYNDALRRAKKQKQLQKKATVGNSKVLSKSAIKKNNRIVAKKFIRKYDTVVGNFGIYADQKIDYITVSEILNNMGFIKNRGEGLDTEERALLFELWWILKGEKYSGVLKQNLCLFLLAIMNIPYKFPKAVPGGYSALALSKDEDSKVTPNKGNNQYQAFQTNGRDSLPDASTDSFYQPNGSTIQDNYYQSKEFFDKLNTARMNQKGSKKFGHFDENGFWSISHAETEEIHVFFQLFYRNMLSNEELGNSKKEEEPSFRPEILETSKALALHYREKLLEETAVLIENETIKVKIPDNGKITHADLLVIQQKAQKAMVEKRKEIIQYQGLKECTFHPQIKDYFSGDPQSKQLQEEALIKNPKMPASSLGRNRTLELYKLARPAGMKKDKNAYDIEYEKNCDECTFQPDTSISKGNPNMGAKQYFAKNIDKTIERLRLGNKERDYLNKWQGRGFPGRRDFQPFTINLGDVYPKENQEGASQNEYQNNLNEDQANNYYNYAEGDSGMDDYNELQPLNEAVQPPETTLIRSKGQEKDRVPLLFVDVNLGPNRSERIIVFEGDRSEDLADRFAILHGLDGTMRQRLKELLDSQISGLLCRIEEEMPSVNSDTESYKQN